MGSRNSRRVYEHGPRRGSAKEADFRTLTNADVDRNLRKYLNRHQRTLAQNASYYANRRINKGLKGLPQYILSDYRFRDYGFPVSWMAPNPSGYAIVKKGSLRRWIFTVFHSFGGSFDWGFLRRNRGAISVPTDVNGHNPRRFIGAMRYLTSVSKTGTVRACVHFGISRRGDWISSVDLNDIAYASGGSLPVGFNKNAYSIGFEFEEHLARHIYGTNKRTRRVYRQPYSKKQILCLAIGLKKINTWRSVIGDSSGIVPWLPDRSSIVAAYKARNGGFIQHLTIHPGKRTDTGAQFLVSKGQKIRFGSSAWNASSGDPTLSTTNGPGPLLESGWDTLERYYNKIRGVKRETQVFKAPLTSVDLQLAKASEIVNVTSSRAQNIAARAGRDRLAGLSRSARMQQQSRRSLYNKAAATNVALSGTIGRANTVVSSVLRKMDLTGVQGVTGAVMFDEVEGAWEDGES
jgi:hypothetical protein